MSDHQQGPGWWVASDGKWYPPDQAPAVPPPETWATPPPGPPATPPRSGMSSGGKVALILTGIVGALLLIGAAALLLGDDDDDPTAASSSTTTTTTDGGDDGPTTTAGGDRAEVPEGFSILEGDGVSIAAPHGWQHLDAADVAMSSGEFADAFPDAPAGMLEQGVNVFEQGAVLVAFDLSGAAFASNVNIIDVPGEAPLAGIEGQAATQLESLGGEVIDSGIVDIAAGEALRIEYTLAVALPDGSTQAASGVQLYVPLDGRTYIITVSTAEDAATLADQMIPTFRVT